MFKVDKQLNYGRHLVREFAASIDKVETVLDVGAGNGVDLFAIRDWHPEAKLYGLEYYDVYADQLEEKGISTFRISFEEEKIPMQDESIDLIISNQVLEHTKEVFWVFNEMFRILRPGGHMILGTPNLASLHNRILLLLGRQPTCIQNNSAHIRGFTVSDVKQLLSVFPNGTKILDRKGANFYPFSPWLAKPLARTLPSMAWANFLLVKKMRTYDEDYFLEFPIKKKLETKFFLGT